MEEVKSIEMKEKRKIIVLAYKSHISDIAILLNENEKEELSSEEGEMIRDLISQSMILEHILINDDFDNCNVKKICGDPEEN